MPRIVELAVVDQQFRSVFARRERWRWWWMWQCFGRIIVPLWRIGVFVELWASDLVDYGSIADLLPIVIGRLWAIAFADHGASSSLNSLPRYRRQREPPARRT